MNPRIREIMFTVCDDLWEQAYGETNTRQLRRILRSARRLDVLLGHRYTRWGG